MDWNLGLSAAQVVIGLVGLAVAGGALTVVVRKNSRRQDQKVGDNSFGIQAGGNVDLSGSDVDVNK